MLVVYSKIIYLKMSDVEGEGASRKTSYKIPRKRVHDILLEDADALGVKRMKLRLKFQVKIRSIV